jgi:hypothetical protein
MRVSHVDVVLQEQRPSLMANDERPAEASTITRDQHGVHQHRHRHKVSDQTRAPGCTELGHEPEGPVMYPEDDTVQVYDCRAWGEEVVCVDGRHGLNAQQIRQPAMKALSQHVRLQSLG